MSKLSDLVGLKGQAVTVQDTADHFATDTVEASLQELASDIDALQAGGGTGGQEVGTLTKTVSNPETNTINLTESVTEPVVTVTKELYAYGATNNDWSIESNDPMWDLEETPGTDPITPAATTGTTIITKSSGVWIADDVGKTIINKVGTGKAIIDAFGKFSDSSTYDHNISKAGNVIVSGAASAGGGSILFDGSGTELTTTLGSEVNFGVSQDFTIEFFIKTTQSSGYCGIFSCAHFSILMNGGNGHLDFYAGGVDFTPGVGVNDGNWHHAALVRSGGGATISWYIDGTLRTSRANTVNVDGGLYNIGGTGFAGAGVRFNGHLDEIRMASNNLYGVSFTPGPLSVTGGTALLIHAVSDEAIADTTITQDFPNTNLIAAGDWSYADGQITGDGKFQAASAIKTAAVTNDQGQIDSSQFLDMNSMSVTDIPNMGEIDYAFSTDGRTTWQIVQRDPGVNIAKSMYLNGSDQYLFRTPSAGNTKTWTVSCWFKLGDFRSGNLFTTNVTPATANGDECGLLIEGGKTLNGYMTGSGWHEELFASNVLGDLSKWYHAVLVVDTTQSEATERAKLYLDGKLVASSTSTTPQNGDTYINDAYKHFIGRYWDGGSGTSDFDGYIADMHFIDGAAIGPEAFGEYNSDGEWIPQDPATQVVTANQQTFVDIANGHSITAYGGTKHTAGQKYFGNSAIKFDGNVDYLEAADSPDWDICGSNTDDKTIDFFVRHNKTGQQETYFLQYGTSMWFLTKNVAGNLSFRVWNGSTYIVDVVSNTPVLTDTDWHHIAMCKVGSDYGIYLDGVQIAHVNSTATTTVSAALWIGQHYGGGGYVNGYMDSIRITHENAFAATPNAGNTDTITVPIAAHINEPAAVLIINSDEASALTSYGTNGFHLDFELPYPDDKSGNANHFSNAGGMSLAANTTDDTPTNNFCVQQQNCTSHYTYNPTRHSFSNSGFDYTDTDNGLGSGTIVMHKGSGKFYCEAQCVSKGGNPNQWLGLHYFTPGGTVSGDIYLQNRNDLSESHFYHSGGSITGLPLFNIGDIFGVAYDAINSTCEVFRNGTSLGTGTVEVREQGHYFGIGVGGPGGTSTVRINFGAKGFTHTPPTGYTPCSTANMVKLPIMDGGQHFAPVTFTGNGSTQKIQCGFQPDLVWIKNRDLDYHNRLIDSVRGNTNTLVTNLNYAETSQPDMITSFDTNGFTLGSNYQTNNNNNSHIAWCWKAGGPAGPNNQGSIESQVSANVAAGFSIVSYTGTGVACTVGHGLSQAPEMVLFKNRTDISSQNWLVYHKSIGDNGYLILNNTTAVTSFVNSFSMDNGVINLPNTWNGYNHADDYIAYCWHSVPGYSKIGSYKGSGYADGPFVYTGFKPAFILWKNANRATDWRIYDTGRDEYNPTNLQLNPNTAAAEGTSGATMDVFDNGFKITAATNDHNADGETIIFMAFAENPFETDLGDWISQRNIVRDNAGTWEVNTGTTTQPMVEEWTAATTNDMFSALKESMDTPLNRMSSINTNLIEDSNWPALGNTLDFAIVIDTTGSTGTPEVSNISFNYDSADGYGYLNPGTDYSLSMPADNKLEITSNVDANIRVKVRN